MASNKNPITSVRMLSRCLGFALVLCVLVLWGPEAVAASNLSCNLTDPQGNVVIRGTIRLSRWAGFSSREAQTDGQGRFLFSNLDTGDYRLTAEYPGFGAVTRTIRSLMAIGRRISSFRVLHPKANRSRPRGKVAAHRDSHETKAAWSLVKLKTSTTNDLRSPGNDRKTSL